MKRVLSIIIFLVSISLSAQKIADYNKLDGSYFGKKYDVYITKSRDTVRVGDSLVIGKTSTDSHFKFINQANQFGGSQLSGHGIKIKKMIVEKIENLYFGSTSEDGDCIRYTSLTNRLLKKVNYSIPMEPLRENKRSNN